MGVFEMPDYINFCLEPLLLVPIFANFSSFKYKPTITKINNSRRFKICLELTTTFLTVILSVLAVNTNGDFNSYYTVISVIFALIILFSC